MKKIIIFVAMFLMSSLAIAEAVKGFEKATNLVVQSIKKHKLLTVPLECVSFVERSEDNNFFYVDVREKHNEKCGASSDIAPRLMTYQVHKETGMLCTDSVEWAEQLQAKDPYSFECRSIR